MSTVKLHQHISKRFDTELENIREQVLHVGGIVEQQLSDALDALMLQDMELADKVIVTEAKVNAMEVNVDEECTNLLARRQPAASDLRLIIAVIKTITDLERVGDEAQKIAKMSLDLNSRMPKRSHYTGMQSMGKHVLQMIGGSLDAFARMDSKEALRIARMEPESDDQYAALFRQQITYMMEDPRHITSSLDIIWCARALERIGDHARNICEYVIYFVEGKDVRHTSLDEMEEEIG